MKKANIFYAQSGGVTAVINATAAGVIQTARRCRNKIGKVYAGKNGILGALKEELIDTSRESAKAIDALRYTPGGAFGSCRYKLKSLEENRAECERLIEVFAAHNIGYFLYNGGGDSQDTVLKVSQISTQLGYPLACIGIPKTVDNDLPYTDSCSGFGSVAKYVAVSILEAGLDVASMAATSTKVFILEVMGRHTGWIAAASGLAAKKSGDAPHVILFPEIAFDPAAFLKRVDECVKKYGYCAVVVSEGIRNHEGKFLSEAGIKDAFGHSQLGGVAPIIARLIKDKLHYKYHWAVADYLQRSARHIASQVDLDQAYALGCAAVEQAVAGKSNIMLTIERRPSKTYRWRIGEVPLEKVANVERKVPRNFITKDGFQITAACREYLAPLIDGEAYPPYKNGLPQYVQLENKLVLKKIKEPKKTANHETTSPTLNPPFNPTMENQAM
ncbi:MAG: 6-phosphofructokinase [Gammaproteobacteria bacterium]